MARGHQEHEPVDFAALDPFQVTGNNPVVVCGLVPVVTVFREVNEALSCRPAAQQFRRGLNVVGQ